MKNFIELTNSYGVKNLVNVMTISYVYTVDNDLSRVVLHSTNENGSSIILYVKESYEEIKEMINSAL